MSRIIIERGRFLRDFEEVDPGLTSVLWTVDENCPICNRPDEVVQLAELMGTDLLGPYELKGINSEIAS